MTKFSALALLLCLPWLLGAASLSLNLDLSLPDASRPAETTGWGSISAPAYPQLPVRTVNVLLPPGVESVSWSHSFSGLQTLFLPAPELNPGFTDGERTLIGTPFNPSNQQVRFLGLKHWGDIAYASFSVLPAIWDGSAWQSYLSLQLTVTWPETAASPPQRIPPVLTRLDKSAFSPAKDFFANAQDLPLWYSPSSAKNYDYLIVSTPALYSALAPLEAFRQSQGLITAFADISVILATAPGATPGEKLRNYLVSQYSANPFSYLLLVGDYDTVPVMYLIPEPDGTETIPSDFFYGDLSSIIDTDNDGRLGEYSPAAGLQDYLCDFTPEVFVGRISTNNADVAAQIAARTVLYEQSSGPWKNQALLPAAFLNYGGEPEPGYLQTDGATFMEYAKATALSAWNCTTMYEQDGFLPSYTSDLALDSNLLKNALSTNSYGLLNWSGHGSSQSSSRKLWLSDDNSNGLPDGWEMVWMGMVDNWTFDNLVSQDGLILFAASCYNGQIDSGQPCLAEYALQKKAVSVCAATRTGWYKIGWRNPGWGGLSSYNLHYLENLARNQLSSGAALAYANLTHTQYYLFGDPVDAGGIIWPELQNVYTYLHYGDPAVGHSAAQTPPLGEILVYEPLHHNGLPIVDALNATGRFNVVYTDKLIPDYDYISRFAAVFCLFGWGDTAYLLPPASLDYALLTSYLNGGGKLYLEGDVGWDPQDPFWGYFGTHCPLNTLAYIEEVQYTNATQSTVWQYDQADPWTMVLLPFAASAQALFYTHNTEHNDYPIGIYNSSGNARTLASSFALGRILPGENDLKDLLTAILDTLGVLDSGNVASDDPQTPPLTKAAYSYPNPFKTGTSLRFETDAKGSASLEIFNLRGQNVRSLDAGTLAKGSHELIWDGRDARGKALPSGIYLWRLQTANSLQHGKMLKLGE